MRGCRRGQCGVLHRAREENESKRSTGPTPRRAPRGIGRTRADPQLDLLHFSNDRQMAATNAEEFSLITAIRYDPLLKSTNNGSPWQVLPFHLDRLRTSATNVGWTKAIDTLAGPEGEKQFNELCEKTVQQYHAATSENEPVVASPASSNAVPTAKDHRNVG